MKYIKTEFSIYEVVEETDLIYRVRSKWTPNHLYSISKRQTNVIAQADTIEELCDEFVCNEMLIYEETEMKWLASQGNNVYGAIWTDKGLIYVAKMNDKGELELL